MPEDKRTKIGPTAPFRPISGSGAAAAAASPTPAPLTPSATPAPSVNPSLTTEPASSTVHITAQMDPLIGKTLANRYIVHKKLGEGGMGAVYLATHNVLEKQVALKVLHGEFVRKPDLVERFMQEAKSASRIRHENVIDVSDFGTTPEGLVFFAMELLKGRDLHEEIARARLAGQRLPWERSKRIFLQVCGALAAAHGLGIVHRDLKPENIYLVDFLGEPDFVKLLDFGIAKMTDVGEGERKLTRTGMLFGTPEYMSPEQARGETVDHRVDVYAMGCILHQLITGRVPFEAENFMGVLSMHLTQPAPTIPGETLDVIGAPRALADVVAQALAKDRNQRFASIDELARAVRRVSGDKATGPVTAQPNVPAPLPTAATTSSPTTTTNTGRIKTQWTGNLTVPEEASASPRPSKLPLVLGGAILILGLGSVGGYIATRGSASTASSPAAPATPAVPAPPAVAAAAPAAVPAPPSAPAALPFEQAQIQLDSTPAGAEVKDLADDVLIGRTPLGFMLRASHKPRRFVVHHKDYVDVVVELVPDRDHIQYTAKLERGKLMPGVVPAVHRAEPAKPSPSTPNTPEPAAAPPAPPAPPALQPAPPGLAPAPVAPAAETPPAAPAKITKPDDDCGDPPCLKADPSRPGAGHGSAP